MLFGVHFHQYKRKQSKYSLQYAIWVVFILFLKLSHRLHPWWCHSCTHIILNTIYVRPKLSQIFSQKWLKVAEILRIFKK